MGGAYLLANPDTGLEGNAPTANSFPQRGTATVFLAKRLSKSRFWPGFEGMPEFHDIAALPAAEHGLGLHDARCP